jgi:formylglycine-generating enzyme required for sulfatase activity
MKRLLFLSLSIGGVLLLPGKPTMAQAAPAAQVQSQSTQGHQATRDDSESESSFGNEAGRPEKLVLPSVEPVKVDPNTPPGTTWVNPNDGLTYVWIPPGKFTMGCSPGDANCDPDEKPREMTIDHGFWMGQTLVTQGAYQRVTGENPSFYKHGDQYPVEKVDYIDAYGYCVAVGMRLPNEAEWEYAARANTTGPRYSDDLNAIAWYKDNSFGHAHPVAQKQPNAFKLYDMLGNMWQWTTEIPGPYSGQVILHGGSWMAKASTVRVSNRGRDTPEGERRFTSFRCVSGSFKDTKYASDEVIQRDENGKMIGVK